MRVGILLFEQFHGKQNIGSSRIRGHWLTNHWPEAETFRMGQQYDVIIYQKVYWIEYAQMMRKVGSKVIQILDLCDPDWLQWGSRVKQMIDLCDAVTTSSEELARYAVKLTDKPVWLIPDRMDLSKFTQGPKAHAGEARTVAWFGYSENFPMLDAAIKGLIDAGIKELIVISSRRQPYALPPFARGDSARGIPDKISLVNYPWTEETVHDDLLKADLVINPRSPNARWRYKSNNKTVTAWALGLPVAHDAEELKALKTEGARVKESLARMEEVRERYDVRKSVDEFKSLIAELQAEREITLNDKTNAQERHV